MQRFGDPPLRLAERNRVQGEARIATRPDLAFEIAQRPSKNETIGDRTDAFQHEHGRRKQEHALLRRDGSVVGERRCPFVE